MRSATCSAAWPAIPARSEAAHRPAYDRGQLNRSLALGALVCIAAATIALQPAHFRPAVGAAYDRAALGGAQIAAPFTSYQNVIAFHDSSAARSAEFAEMQIGEFVNSDGELLPLIVGLAAFSQGPFGFGDPSPRCVDVTTRKAMVAAHFGQCIALNAAEWEFLRRVDLTGPQPPSGSPHSDPSALALSGAKPQGIIFFIDGAGARTPTPAPAKLRTMVAEAATATIKARADGV